MDLKDFVKGFAEQFDDTDISLFNEKTNFQELEEWSSLVAMSIIAFIKTSFDKQVTGKEIRSCITIEELYNLILFK